MKTDRRQTAKGKRTVSLSMKRQTYSLSSRHKDQVEDVPLGADVDEDLLSSLLK